MNFYNPYLYAIPTASTAPSLLSRLSFGSILNGASRTLNFVNQAIPVFKQMSPLMKNLKTMFNVMNEFKKTDIENTLAAEEIANNVVATSAEGPTFFIKKVLNKN